MRLAGADLASFRFNTLARRSELDTPLNSSLAPTAVASLAIPKNGVW